MVKKIFKIICMIMTLSLVVNTDTHAFFFFNKGVKNNSSEVLNKNSTKNTTLSITNVSEILIDKLTSQLIKNGDNAKFHGLSKLFDNVNGSIILTNLLVKSNDAIDLAADFTNVDANKFELVKGRFLVNSAGNTTLTIINIKEDLTNKLASQMIKTKNEFRLHGFNFSSIDNNAINSLNLSKLFDNVNGSITISNSLVKNSSDIDFDCVNCEDGDGI